LYYKTRLGPMKEEVQQPVHFDDDSGFTISNIGLPGFTAAQKVSVKNGFIREIEDTKGEVQWVCLPALADIHVHANRAFTIGNKKPKNFDDAVKMTADILNKFTLEDHFEHAFMLFNRAYVHGTTKIRTHADVSNETGLKALRGTLKAKEAIGEKMDIDVVAFASSNIDPVDKKARNLLKEAIDSGAAFLGAVPVFYANPKESIDALIRLAIDLNVSVDVHQDEHLDPENVWSEYLAESTIRHDYQGRVFLSHGCALSTLNDRRRNQIIEKILKAKITVISLPLTNLYLQDRHHGTPIKRGLAPVKELIENGVEVRFGTDNICDAFYPFGDADLLDTAYVAMLASQIDDSETILRTVCDGITSIGVGDRADLVLIEGTSFDDIFSRRPPQRIILKEGQQQIV